MRIVLFTAGGPLGFEALRALEPDHELVGVVRMAPRRRWPWSWIRRARGHASAETDPVTAWVAERGLSPIEYNPSQAGAIIPALHAARPDLICIAGFPRILGQDLLTIPPRGAVNLHPSLLPRHRGPNPLFWIYYHDDRETGVTAHQATDRADAGPILGQRTMPLPRGLPITELYLRAAAVGAELLREAVRSVAEGVAHPIRQDDRRATPAPRVSPGSRMARFDEWDCERVWHFLAGVCPRFREPLRDGSGREVPYQGVGEFERCRPLGSPGTVAADNSGWLLWCTDGAVRLLRGKAAR